MIRTILSHLSYLTVGLMSILVSLWLTTSLVHPVFSANTATPMTQPGEEDGERDGELDGEEEGGVAALAPEANQLADQTPNAELGENPVQTPNAPTGDLASLRRRVVGISELEAFLQQFNYSAEGRRDPFQPYEEVRITVSGEVLGPLLPLQRFDLDQLKLVGIIWDVTEPKAMFLDPGANVHLVGKDDRIGRNNGYIAVIREGEVVIIETTEAQNELMYSSRVIRLNR